MNEVDKAGSGALTWLSANPTILKMFRSSGAGNSFETGPETSGG